MSDSLTAEPIILGFDPGGEKAFGCALLHGRVVRTAIVGSVGEAMAWAIEVCGPCAPMAVGIDTLLHWTTARGGWRPCDLLLRRVYPAARNSVMSPNSLFGAMAVGGVALALCLRRRWPDIVLNETHPKVLLHALGRARYTITTIADEIAWFGQETQLALPDLRLEHAYDAAVSAWATAVSTRRGWDDIVGDDDALIFPAGTVEYRWPLEFGGTR